MVKTKLLLLLLIICSIKTTCMYKSFVNNLLNDEHCIINQNGETVYDMQYFLNNHLDAITTIFQDKNSTYYLASLITTKHECSTNHPYARSLLFSLLDSIKFGNNELKAGLYHNNFSYKKLPTDSLEELHEQLYNYFTQDTLSDDHKLLGQPLTTLLMKIFFDA